jgi:hypothetical protein
MDTAPAGRFGFGKQRGGAGAPGAAVREDEERYLACSPVFFQFANFLLNFSTRPVVSTNFIFPVKNGCDALEISKATLGYVCPSVQTMVWFVFTVEQVRMEKFAA